MSSKNSPTRTIPAHEVREASDRQIDTQPREPQYVLGRLNLPWAKQHRIADPTAEELETACQASGASNTTFTVREFDPDQEKCQHQSCFGADHSQRQDVIAAENPSDYDEPLVRSTNNGRLHKPDDGAGYPACGVRLQKSHWVVVEGSGIDEDDIQFCLHQDCFGDGRLEGNP